MEWKEIPNFPGYSINRDGYIMTTRRTNPVIMQPQLFHGYYKQNLFDGTHYTHKYIHRLLAEAFLPNPENLPEVDHIDRNPLNNDLSNLRWVTKSDNKINRRSKLGKLGEKHIRLSRKSYQVTITRNRKAVFCKCFDTLEEAIQARDIYLGEI